MYDEKRAESIRRKFVVEWSVFVVVGGGYRWGWLVWSLRGSVTELGTRLLLMRMPCQEIMMIDSKQQEVCVY